MNPCHGVAAIAVRFVCAFVLAISFRIAAANSLSTPAALEETSGSGQLGRTGQFFPLQLTARVTDAQGHPVQGVTVYFEADHCRNDGTFCLLPSGYPFFEGPSPDAAAVSDADGVAVAPTLAAGDTAANFEVVATIYADGPTSAVIAHAYYWVQQVDALPTVPITSGFTGAWYDPNQSGHGLFVEVLSDNRVLAYWFTFTPDGTQQAWFGGVGAIVGNQAIVYADQGQGGRWIPGFDAALFRNQRWGSLTFAFTDCDHGVVYLAGEGDASIWGRGSMDITRLTQPAGVSCH